MPRSLCALAVLVAAAALSHSADPRAGVPPAVVPLRAQDEPKGAAGGLAGNWKLTLPVDRGELLILIALTEKEGKWSGEILGTSRKVGMLAVGKVSVTGDVLRFSLNAGMEEVVNFEGLLSKDKKKLNGSLSVGGQQRATSLLSSKLKKLDDSFAVAREMLAQVEDGPEMFEFALDVLGSAGEKKLPADEARGIVERVNKAAGTYGPRWERDVSLRLIEALAGQEGLSELAIAQAKRAERLLTDDDTTATRMTVLEALVRTFTKAGKPDEAKQYVAQLAKLELRDFAEYSKTHPPFKVEPFAGRKAKSEKVAVVEEFTGAGCETCAGMDLAFAGLVKAYKPTDVVLLRYHLHISEPDPLTAPDGMERLKYYREAIRRPPILFVGGKKAVEGEGNTEGSEKLYKTARGAIDELLEKPAGAKLALTVSKGEKGGFSAKATVTDLDTPGEQVMLRFVLAEDRVRYAGSNGVRYHHMVVRAMPGGAKGVALTKKAHEQTVQIDPDAVKAAITKYLDEFAKEEAAFPRGERPLALRNLKLIALVQNDANKEILHAVQVDLEAK
jgi:hypothetical protein